LNKFDPPEKLVKGGRLEGYESEARSGAGATDLMSSDENSGGELRSAASLQAEEDLDPELLTVYRVVVGFLLASLLWKARAIPLFYSIYSSLPLYDEFFPTLLRSPQFLAVSFLLPVGLCVAVFFVRSRLLLGLQAIVTCAGMFILCVHQGTYNDVTFVTCFWTSVWGLWFVSRSKESPESLLPKAKAFAMLIISLIFLGGAVGKWTPGYWSGEVFYEIYFVERDFWVFNWLRNNYGTDELRSIAMYYSRMAVLTESACAFLWLLPVRYAGLIAISVFMGIALFSNIHLFSVMFCLLGLAIVAMHETKNADLKFGEV
jgi:hypothetical protein